MFLHASVCIPAFVYALVSTKILLVQSFVRPHRFLVRSVLSHHNHNPTALFSTKPYSVQSLVRPHRNILKRSLICQHNHSLTALFSSKRNNMPRGVAKENLPSKVCVVCNRPFTWRKKWERCWDEVTTCSKGCNAKRRKAKQETGSGYASGED